MHTLCAPLADAATLPLCLFAGDFNIEGASIMVGGVSLTVMVGVTQSM